MKVLLFSMLLLGASVVNAHATTSAEHSDHESSLKPHPHHHHLGLFLGNTEEGHKEGLSIGLDYEYRLDELIGVGGLFEYVGGDLDAWVLAVPVFFHPYKHWRFVAAPGLEYKRGKSKFLVRTGVAYSFAIGGRWTISPEFNVDWFDRDEALVYGISIGYGF